MALMTTAHASALAMRLERELTADGVLSLASHDDGCDACRATRAILGELTALSPRLRLERHAAGEHVPETKLYGRGQGHIRFLGLPSGYEFPVFIDGVVSMANGESSLPDDARARLQPLSERVKLRVLTAPT